MANWLTSWFFRSPEQKATINTSLDLWREVYGGGSPAKSGQNVNWQSALAVSTVFACVQKLADGVSTIPCKLFIKDSVSGTRAPAVDHSLFDVLGNVANPWQTSQEYRQTLMFHVALTGDHFAFVNRIRGQVTELIPILPGQVTVEQQAGLNVVYKVQINGQVRLFPSEAIFHVRGASWDSLVGLEPIAFAREAIGLGLATEEAHARLHKNGVRTSGLYSVEGDLDIEGFKRLRAWIAQNYEGDQNFLKPMILDKRAQFTPIAMTGVDAQHLETRRFQVEEICRMFGIQPTIIGHTDKTATYASAEQMFLAHAVHTLRPWHEKIAATMQHQLLTKAERQQGYYVKFIDSALLRGDAKSRAAYYQAALGTGGAPAWMTPNEIRELEELDPIDGGDELPKPPPVPAPAAAKEKVPA